MKHKILFLETDRFTQGLYKSMANSHQFAYQFANTISSATELLGKEHFDIIVANCQFGYGKISNALHKIPSIIISSGKVKELNEQLNDLDLIIRDKHGKFIDDLFSLIEILIEEGRYYEAIHALPIHSN